ncbi:hypothetical protein F2Q69_00063926 [Brassica cretica]|uniref:U-box domain-containing protein n=1 Tax=Brassica cretica TaxID=69181 RepID=A0A8S9RKG6_BRACR|nr:hypothetical protein F2Q69_00063926 [Brassica cretica]
MREPRVAADGFTYGDGALREWLHDGHETSPVTKLQILSLPTITLSLTTPMVYYFALQVYTIPAQHLNSTWSSPLSTTSASTTTSSTASWHTSYMNAWFHRSKAAST